MGRILAWVIIGGVLIYLLMVLINVGGHVIVGPPPPTPTQLPSLAEGCRQVEYRASQVLGVKDQVMIEAFTYDMQVFWCWRDGEITESHILRQIGEPGGIPGWTFVRNLDDSNDERDAIGRRSWTETAVGEFALCLPLSFSTGQRASIGISGSFCPLQQSARIDTYIDGKGNYRADCGKLTCELISASDT